MREILFRAKTTSTPEWVEGYYTFDGKHWIERKSIERPGYWEANPIDPKSLGEFTGLYDRNGVKIFEGDIVKEIFEGTRSVSDNYTYVDEYFYGYKIGRVSFTGTGTFIIAQYGELRVNGEKVDSYTPSKRKRIAAYRSEVIGNIYDNPELLKEVQNND